MKYGKWFGLFAVALVVAIASAPAFAEVQNVRVGGDLTTYGFIRENLRLSDDHTNGVGGPTGNTIGSGSDEFAQSHVGLNVSADLTDNVSADVRLLHQRVWGSHSSDATDAASGNPDQVDVASAFVTLEEFLYAPLTLKIGRQPLWYGKGFIVGGRLLAGDVDPEQNLASDEVSGHNGFDAIRATLDAPAGVEGITVDGLYAQVSENVVSANDDVKLYGVNVGWKGDASNAEAEVYYFLKRDNDRAALPSRDEGKGSVSTLGIRGSGEPVTNIMTWGELAMQFGKRANTPNALSPAGSKAEGTDHFIDAEGVAGDSQQAWAVDVGVDYAMPDTTWTPKFGGEWIFYSGKETNSSPTGVLSVGAPGGAIAGWDPIFRGKFDTVLREFQAIGYYLPTQSGNSSGGQFGTMTNSSTNQHQLALHATINPLDALSVDNRWTWFIADKGYIAKAGNERKHFIGTEWDLNMRYAYSEDVSLGLIYGVFWPGAVFQAPFDNIAQELVTSLKVTF